MAILNRIINILILLAAIAAVVFSYLLFSKREKLVDGWAQMAKAVNTAAQTLDKDSGTTFATDLAPEKMAHTNYENLGQVLPKLNEAATKVRDQRNDLAQAVIDACVTLVVPNVKIEELKNVKNYKSQVSAFQSGVKKFRENRDKLAESIIQLLELMDVRGVTKKQLTDPKSYSVVIGTAKDRAKIFAKRVETYEYYLKEFNKAMGFGALKNLRDDSYKPILEDALGKFKKAKKEADKAKSDLKSALNKIKSLEAQIKKLNAKLSETNDQLRQRESYIKHMEKILTMNGSLKLPEKLLTAADKRECYPYVRGTIEYVDSEYGFITINIGSSYVFVQKYGTRENPVHFPLEKGKIMTVVRDPDSATPTVIGKVYVARVEEKISVCNLIGGHPELYKAGDAVIFTVDDIEKALEGGSK
ncbi:MAG: hypothetical protein IJS14_06390 [Lentisphaeria bacterium]|nr:hypothetical protein [Lentisphaeria bacterium]